MFCFLCLFFFTFFHIGLRIFSFHFYCFIFCVVYSPVFGRNRISFFLFFFYVLQGNKVFDWSQEQQGVILSSFYWGYVITQIPGALLSQRFGGKPVFFWSILLSALCTIVTPTIVQTSEYYKQ